MKLSDIQDGEIIDESILEPPRPKKPHVDVTTPAKNIQKVSDSVEGEKLSNYAKTLSFKITPGMEKWVNTAIDLCSDSPSVISPVCNLSREAWYRWNKYPGFYDWFLEQYKAGRKRWLPKLDNMGMDRARKSFDYWKAMNQKAGDLLDESRNVGITGQNVVAILGGVTINNIKQEKEPVDDK